MKIVRKGTRIAFGPVRLSYVHVLEAYAFEGGQPKFSCNALIPKGEKELVKELEAAIKEAEAEGSAKLWKGAKPKYDSPVRDGDEKADDVYKGHWFVNPKSTKKPQVIDKDNNPITSEDDVYSGAWFYVSIAAYPYSVSGSKGVALALNNLKKFKDDERLSGGPGAEEDFAEFGDEEDDL